VRDSKMAAAPALAFPVATLTAFVAAARRGDLYQR
jgi:hypothetical protein